MSKSIESIVLVAESHELSRVVDRVAHDPTVGEISELTHLKPGDSLGASIGANDTKNPLASATVLLVAGVSVLVFLKSLRDSLKDSEARITAADPNTGRTIGEVSGITTDAGIKNILGGTHGAGGGIDD